MKKIILILGSLFSLVQLTAMDRDEEKRIAVCTGIILCSWNAKMERDLNRLIAQEEDPRLKERLNKHSCRNSMLAWMPSALAVASVAAMELPDRNVASNISTFASSSAILGMTVRDSLIYREVLNIDKEKREALNIIDKAKNDAGAHLV